MGQPMLIHLAEVDSTQTFLRRHPELGHCGVLADAQSEGRGRQGNRWESARGGGLWLSASLPSPNLAPGVLLQHAMAAVIDVLNLPGLGLKWPNDLVAWKDGRMVKLGGIIGELTGGRFILGLGLNLQAAPVLPDRAIPPAALADLEPGPWDAVDLAVAIMREWESLPSPMRDLVRWPDSGMPLCWEGGQGVCLGWEPDGRLKVTTAEGIQRLSAGEVSGLYLAADLG